jgi:hypothetical protein
LQDFSSLIESLKVIMTPLAVVIAIVFGSAVTITVGLAMVLVVLMVASSSQVEFGRDLVPLLYSFLLFMSLALVGGGALVWEFRQHRYRFWAQGLMWLWVLALGAYYWPKA